MKQLRNYFPAFSFLFLSLLSFNSWAISVSPNPSFNGSYTASWSTSLGHYCTSGYQTICYYGSCGQVLITNCTDNYLQQSVGGGAWATVTSSQGLTSQAFSGKAPNNYQYKIFTSASYSINNGTPSITTYDSEGPASVTVVPGTPATPSGPSLDTDGAYTISWSGVSGATYYQLQEYYSAWNTIVSANQTSVARSGRSSGVWYYRVRACASTGCGNWSGNKSVDVNYTPVAVADGITTSEDVPLTYNVVGNDTDAENNVLNVAGVTQPAHGGVSYSAGSITYTPAANYHGADSFTYTATDGTSTSNAATVSVTVNSVNDNPVAAADNATTDEDNAVVIAVLANDSDVDGDTLTVSAVSSPSHGTAVTDGTTITYTPAPNYNGTDSFNYNISDGNGGIANASVAVTINSVIDQAGDVTGLTAPAGSADGNIPLNWTAAPGDVSYHKVEQTFEGQTSIINTGSAATSFTVNVSANGVYQYRVRACDANNFCGAYSNSVTTVVSQTTTVAAAPTPSGGDADAGPELGGVFYGVVAGSHTVTGSGGAAYTVPIDVPKGTAGVQPALALSYSSQGGNGLLGYGWALSGVSSAISRCPQTEAQNGNRHAVDYTNNDRFCLNGQQLVAETGAVYGANNTEYRTEVDGFSRITSYDTNSDNDPESFKVETKSGLILYFGDWDGASPDARIEVQGGTAGAVWALKRVEDRYGNYYRIDYFEDNANSEYRPLRIDYTGNDAVVPALAPYVRVELVYEDRTDAIVHYYAGHASRQSKRLTNIKTYVDADASGTFDSGELVRDYQLTYETVDATQFPRLKTLTLCVPDSTLDADTAPDCTAPTSFDWIAVDQSYDLKASQDWTAAAPLAGALQKWADLNGDGRMDYMTSNGASHYVSLVKADGSGYETVQTWTAHAKGSSGFETFLDLNGDGLADYVTTDSNGNHYWSLSTGSGYNNVTYATGVSVTAGDVQRFIDVNGDGLPDYLRASSTSYTVLMNNAGGGYAAAQSWSGGPDLTGATFNFHDVNQDGRTDLVVVSGTTHAIYVNNGAGFNAPFSRSAHPSSNETGFWADLNGDGLADYVTIDATDTTKHYVSFWTGSDYVSPAAPWIANAIDASGVPEFRDFNGDGLTDFLTADNVGNHKLSLSNGRDGYVNVTWANGTTFGSNNVYDFVDLDGDGKLDFAAVNSDGSQNVAINRSAAVHLMTQVTDGLGVQTTFTYTPLTDTTVYTKGSGAIWPLVDVVNPTYVVKTMSHSNGIGGTVSAGYHYSGFKYDRSGRGSLGFSQATVYDNDRDTTALSQYSQTWPFTGAVTHKEVRQTSSNRLLTEADITYAQKASAGSFATLFTFADSQTQKLYDPDTGTLLSTAVTTNAAADMDDYGNSAVTTVSVIDKTNADQEHRTVTTRTISNDVTNWLLGQVDQTVTQNYLDATYYSDRNRTNGFTYNAFGQVETVTVEPGRNTAAEPLEATTTYGYDNFGNRISETLSTTISAGLPESFAARTETVAYDSRGRFPVLLTNAEGHQSMLAFDPLLGLVDTITVINDPSNSALDLVTTRDYDNFGRLLNENRPDGTSAGAGYYVDSSGTNLTAAIYTEVMATGGTPLRIFYDNQGREVRRRVKSFDGATFIHSDTEYDSRGRVKRSSQPYFVGETVHWNTPAYDDFNRIVGVTAADATQNTTTVYTGFTVTSYDTANRSTTTVKNAVGQVVSVQDEFGNTTEYGYDTVGNVVTVTKAAGDTLENTVTNTYDRLGRRISTTDPDAGLIETHFDALGELTEQITPELRNHGQSLTLQYDLLGRPIQRSEPTVAGSTDVLTTSWSYDDITNNNLGVGKLTQEIQELTDGSGTTTQFSRSYRYDAGVAHAAGKPTSTVTTIEDNGAHTYILSYTYDSAGRLDTLTYPESPSYTGAPFAVKYNYNARGYLEQVVDAAVPATVFYQPAKVDALGHITSLYMGDGSLTTRGFAPGSGRLTFTNAAIDNGGNPEVVQNFAYQYDAVGNMHSRSDLLHNLTETFTYDALDRLTQSDVNDGTATTSTYYGYDNLGNVDHKSDFSSAGFGAYSYGTGNAGGVTTDAGNHAVTSVALAAGGTATYSYDDDGNQLTGDGRTLTWSSYDKPVSISKDGITREFRYGPDRSRYWQKRDDGVIQTTIHFLDKLYEKITLTSGIEIHRHYIVANGQRVALQIDTDNNGTVSTKTKYMHSDHLGSITSVTTVISGGLDNIKRLSYDAFGKSRNALDWVSAPTDTNFLGYTGHEMLDDVGLIHMNGRVYDPELGRMLSPDPIIGNPLDGQNWNRYSYVLNNPLKYTDPSGFVFENSTIIDDSKFDSSYGNNNISFKYSSVKSSYSSTCTSDSVGTCSSHFSSESLNVYFVLSGRLFAFSGSWDKSEIDFSCTSGIPGMCAFAEQNMPYLGNAQLFAAVLGQKLQSDPEFTRGVANYYCSQLPNGCTAPATTSPGGSGDGNNPPYIDNSDNTAPTPVPSSGANAAQISAGSGGGLQNGFSTIVENALGNIASAFSNDAYAATTGARIEEAGQVGSQGRKNLVSRVFRGISGIGQIAVGGTLVVVGGGVAIVGAAACEAGLMLTPALAGCAVIPEGAATLAIGTLASANGLIHLNNAINNKNDPDFLEGLFGLLGGDGGAKLGKSIQTILDIVGLSSSSAKLIQGAEAGGLKILDAIDFGTSVENKVNQ